MNYLVVRNIFCFICLIGVSCQTKTSSAPETPANETSSKMGETKSLSTSSNPINETSTKAKETKSISKPKPQVKNAKVLPKLINAQNNESVTSEDMEKLWESMVKSSKDLDVLESAKLIEGVPIIAVNNKTSVSAAALGSIVLYHEYKKNISFTGKSGEFATSLRAMLEELKPDLPEKDMSSLMMKLWRKFPKIYNKDIYNAAVSYGRKFTKGEVFSLAIHSCLQEKGVNNIINDSIDALRIFLKKRDVLVNTEVTSSWRKYKESIIRNMPTLILYNNSIHVGVGYIVTNGKNYVVAISPSKSNIRDRAARDIMTPVDKAIGGENVAILNSLSGNARVRDEYKTKYETSMAPGIHVLPISNDMKYVLLHKWRRDMIMFKKRIQEVSSDE